MPIYEYCCDSCGHELEVIQKLADDPLKHCPECDESTLRKKISAVAFRLKGSGWYETDFKTEGKKNLVDGDKPDAKSDNKSETKSENKSEGKAEGKSDNKSESKPASKAEAKPSASKSDSSGNKTSSTAA